MKHDELSVSGSLPPPCSACGGCGMLPGTGPNDDVMNTPCPECNEWARHDQAWQKSFITPIAKEMKKRGVAYLLITIRDDGKAAFVIEPNAADQGAAVKPQSTNEGD